MYCSWKGKLYWFHEEKVVYYSSSCLWPLYVEDKMLVKPYLTLPPPFTMNATHQSFLTRIDLYPVPTLQPSHEGEELSINNAQNAPSALSVAFRHSESEGCTSSHIIILSLLTLMCFLGIQNFQWLCVGNIMSPLVKTVISKTFSFRINPVYFYSFPCLFFPFMSAKCMQILRLSKGEQKSGNIL